MGSTQHPRDATRERCADEQAPSGDCEYAASDLSLMYAGDRGRKERRSSNHWRRSSERSLDRDGVPSGSRRDFVEPSAFGCAERRGGFSPRGGSTGIPPVPSGPVWDAAEVLPSGTHWSQTRPVLVLPFGAGSRGAERSSLRAGSDRHRRAVDLRADGEHRTQEPDKAETPCLPSTFRVEDAEAVWNREAKRPARKRLGGATARQHRKSCRSKAHGSIERCGAERLRGRNGLLGGTTP